MPNAKNLVTPAATSTVSVEVKLHRKAVRVSRRGFLGFSAALLGSRRLSAWQQQDDAKFSTGVNVVNVLVSVHDKQGQTVRGLTANDFTLDEDGHPQTIRYFARETDLPLTIGLMVDTSASQRRVLDAERGASFRFLDQVLRETKTRSSSCSSIAPSSSASRSLPTAAS